MFTFLKNKLLYKKWLNFTLFLGMLLLITVLMILPIYQNTALYKLLQNTYDEAVVAYNTSPLLLKAQYTYLFQDGNTPTDTIMKDAEACKKSIVDETDIDVSDCVTLIENEKLVYTTDMILGNARVTRFNMALCHMTNMEQHIQLTGGRMPVDGINENGYYECIVSHKLIDDMGLYLNQVLYPEKMDDPENRYQLQIVGIFDAANSQDMYWTQAPSDYDAHLFVSADAIDMFHQALIANGMESNYFVTEYVFGEYMDLSDAKARQILTGINRLINKEEDGRQITITSQYPELMKPYLDEANRLSALIFVLQIPIFLMMAVFIFMVANELIRNELNEISMLRSRGVGILQVLGIYSLQSLILALLAYVIAIPLAFLLTYILSHANAFLSFDFHDAYGIIVTPDFVLYGVVGVLLSVIFVVLSCVPYLKRSIVEQKSKRNRFAIPFVHKYFLDIILLGLAVYLLHNFNTQADSIATSIINGENLDPVIYISATLFMVGFGLLALRLMDLLKRLLYHLGKKHWKPDTYAAFLQMIRTGKKQILISIFMVMTISLGIFNANMANTIQKNEEKKLVYQTGADCVFTEYWIPLNAQDGSINYLEPDAAKVDTLANQVAGLTKVYCETDATLNFENGNLDNIMLMGISPKRFGEIANMPEGLTAKHWYHSLNSLSENMEGAIISKNLAEAKSLKIGDTIKITRYNDKGTKIAVLAKPIVAIIEAFPSYAGYSEIIGEDGNIQTNEQYLVVTSFNSLISKKYVKPYAFWVKFGDNKNAVKEYIDAYNVSCTSFSDLQDNLDKKLNSSLIQITNGVLTMSFVFSLMLCMIGFLMYWILSIKERELLFGVYRAMGMTVKEIFHMLTVEQLLSSATSFLCGIISGFLTSELFMKVFTLAYTPHKHLITYTLSVNPVDMVRLAVVMILMMTVCLVILVKQIKSLNIVHALKLGEE